MKKSGLPYVYKSTNGQHWHWKPYIKKADQKKYPHIEIDSRGQLKNPISLCPTSASDRELRAIYVDQEAALFCAPDRLTIQWLWDQYIESRKYKKLKAKTQERYTGTAQRLFQHEFDGSSGKTISLGNISADKLNAVTIRQMLDNRYAKHQAKPGAEFWNGSTELNHEMVVLKNIYNWGMQYTEELAALKRNPLDSMDTFPTRKREHKVTEEAYVVVYNIALELKNRPYLPIFMELSYLLATRGVEITDELTVGSRVTIEEGDAIRVVRRKNSKTTLIRCTERLDKAWKAALALHKIDPVSKSPLLVNQSGDRVSRNAIRQAWNKAIRPIMIERGLMEHYFTPHDLKKMAITHSKDKGIAGQSEAMQRLYNLEEKIFDAPE